MAMIDENFVGMSLPDRVATIERGQLRLFAMATGETNSVYFDVAAARAQGHEDVLAPPTFAFCLEQLTKPQFDWIAEIGIDIDRMLHAEQSFEYYRNLHAGDEVTLKSRVADRYLKKSGALEFVFVETDFFNQHDEHCVRQRTGVVVQHA